MLLQAIAFLWRLIVGHSAIDFEKLVELPLTELLNNRAPDVGSGTNHQDFEMINELN